MHMGTMQRRLLLLALFAALAVTTAPAQRLTWLGTLGGDKSVANGMFTDGSLVDGHWQALVAPIPGKALSFSSAVIGLDKKGVARSIEILPRGFVPNQGQWDYQAAWSAPGFFGATWVTNEGELRHVLLKWEECEREPDKETHDALARREKPCSCGSWILSERFAGGKVGEMQGKEPLGTQVSYFVGSEPAKHRAGLTSYGRLYLGEVWPGVTVSIKARQKTVEKIFEVKPFADPSVIRIALQGAEMLTLNERGELVVSTGYGDVVFSSPMAWQEENGMKKPVPVSYRIDNKSKSYAFTIGPYDKTRPVIIDPLLASTFVGGTGGEASNSLAIAQNGDVYVTGYTTSTDFPMTAGAYDTSQNGGNFHWDVFVSRFNADLTSLLASTYLGGSDYDWGNSLAIAQNGDVYVTGYTGSTDFPTAGAYDPSWNGGTDVFVSKLSPDLTSLLASTYLGGQAEESGRSLAIGTGGEVYVTGWTESTNFPTTAGAYDTSFNGGYTDVFVSRFNADLASLEASTFLGGSAVLEKGIDEEGRSLALGANGTVYVTGYTFSSNFPTTAGAYDPSWNGSKEVFVSRLSPDLTSLMASTFLGGSWLEEGRSLAIGAGGAVYVTGWTASSDFPTTAGAYDSSFSGGSDVFVSRLNADLTSLEASTYLGGSGGGQEATSLTIGAGETVYVAGRTGSYDFPTTDGAYDTSFNGGWDVFVSRLNADLTSLEASTFLGGSDTDEGLSLALGGDGTVYVTGFTVSSDFPTTPGAYDPSFNGGESDVFVSRLDANLSGSPTGVTEQSEVPSEFAVLQNYPNPFNPTTTIRFSIPQRSHVTLKVFDVLGREVATLVEGELNAGEHSVVFNADGLPSGVYFTQMKAGDVVQRIKIMVLK